MFHIFISKGECSLANTNKEFYNAAYKVSTKLCNFLKSTLSWSNDKKKEDNQNKKNANDDSSYICVIYFLSWD